MVIFYFSNVFSAKVSSLVCDFFNRQYIHALRFEVVLCCDVIMPSYELPFDSLRSSGHYGRVGDQHFPRI